MQHLHLHSNVKSTEETFFFPHGTFIYSTTKKEH